jgi:hypothetical protein
MRKFTEEEIRLKKAGFELSDPLDRPSRDCHCAMCKAWFADLSFMPRNSDVLPSPTPSDAIPGSER